MPGGLLQLVAYGAQDAYLTGNPQITFWKGLFKRHTNFSMEAFRINFSGQPSWGTKQTAIVGRHADLLYSTYVEVQLPYYGNDGTNESLWNNDGSISALASVIKGGLGFNLIEYIELDIGGQIVDKVYGEFMYLWSKLTSDYAQTLKIADLVSGPCVNNGATDLSNNSSNCNSVTGRPNQPNTLYIPLYFFFTKNPGAALPLIALQYHEVKINVQWNTSQFIAGDFRRSGTAQNINNLPNPTAALYIDYIYLDTEERRRMAQQSHEYLIEQTQYNEDQEITSANNRLDLTFNHPVKELIWVVQPHFYRDCKSSQYPYEYDPAVGPEYRLAPFTYDVPAVYEQWLQINGQDRMDRRYGDYFNRVQPYQHHTGTLTGSPAIYCYSFALRPEEHQPSGTCNFSRIDTATIVMNFAGGYGTSSDIVVSQENSWDVRVYAINYNILRVMSGMAGLAYSN